MKEKTKRRLRLLVRVVGGICVALVVLALVLATHTQIVVGGNSGAFGRYGQDDQHL